MAKKKTEAKQKKAETPKEETPEVVETKKPEEPETKTEDEPETSEEPSVEEPKVEGVEEEADKVKEEKVVKTPVLALLYSERVGSELRAFVPPKTKAEVSHLKKSESDTREFSVIYFSDGSMKSDEDGAQELSIDQIKQQYDYLVNE